MKFHFLDDFYVRFAETDAAGLVHFTHFLRWAENAEGDFFRRKNLQIFEKDAAGTFRGWPRVALSAEFMAPARYADCVRVGIRPLCVPAEDSRCIEWAFEISRVEETAGRTTLLARGSWKTVFAEIGSRRGDGSVVPAPAIPAPVRVALRAFLENV